MRKFLLSFTLVISLLTTACTPVEISAYRTIVGAKAFLDSEKKAHPECNVTTPTSSGLCQALAKATSAKDAVIDIVEVYCSSPQFDTNGGKCTPPTDPTVQNQVAVKIEAAIAIYNQAEKDLKGVL